MLHWTIQLIWLWNQTKTLQIVEKILSNLKFNMGWQERIFFFLHIKRIGKSNSKVPLSSETISKWVGTLFLQWCDLLIASQQSLGWFNTSTYIHMSAPSPFSTSLDSCSSEGGGVEGREEEGESPWAALVTSLLTIFTSVIVASHIKRKKGLLWNTSHCWSVATSCSEVEKMGLLLNYGEEE